MYIKCLINCQDRCILIVKDIIVIYRKNETILYVLEMYYDDLSTGLSAVWRGSKTIGPGVAIDIEYTTRVIQ